MGHACRSIRVALFAPGSRRALSLASASAQPAFVACHSEARTQRAADRERVSAMTAHQQKSRTSQHLALPIRELGCAGAARGIEHALRDVPGVTLVNVNPVTEMAYVEYDSLHCDENALSAVLDRAGYLEKPVEPPLAAIKPGSGYGAGVRRMLSAVWRAAGIARHRPFHRSANPGRSP